MRLFKSDWVDRVLLVLKVPDDVPIENKRVTGAIANAQGQVESQNFESRKNVLKYDDVMSRQREVIYGERREVLEGADLHDQISGFLDDVVAAYVTAATEEFPEEWDLDSLWTALRQLYPVGVSHEQLAAQVGGREELTREDLIEHLQADAQEAYARREAEIGSEVMRELERRVLLSVLDRKWREHLYEMDYLREGIYLRAYSQRDPLVEYQREGFDMFAAMMEGIKEEAVQFLFHLDVQLEDEVEEAPEEAELVEAAAPQAVEPPARAKDAPHIHARGLEAPSKPQNLSYSAPTEGGEVEVTGTTVTNADDPFAGIGRNATCPCGSGKKYKKCHGAPGGPTGLTTRVNG